MKKEEMPKGWRRKIHEITGYTITYISYVVLEKRPANTEAAKEIMEVAWVLLEQNKLRKKGLKRKIEKYGRII